MKFQAVIFDFNGTLFWDTGYHNRAWDIFLKKHNLKLTDEEKIQKIHGRSNDDIIKSLFNNGHTLLQIQQMGIEKELIYQDIISREKIQFAPGVEDFMSFLKQRKVDFTIATSSIKTNIDFYIRHMGLAKWVDPDKIVFEDGSFRSKPNGDIFLLAMQKLNALPEEVLIFEDSPVGIMAAQNAGAAEIIIVNSTNRDYSHLPFKVIKHFDDVDRELF
jgi:HAD superfamily hydrolase (TIGR01509 family)